MKAMIFAAGLGTRLKPMTDTMPKALVPVAGRPLLYHVAHKIIDAGFGELVINTHHFAGMIEEYVHDQNGFGADVVISHEPVQPLETGGGILNARPLLEGCGRFLVHNVDIISDLDLRWFMDQARPDAVSTLLVSQRESSRYLLFDDGMRLVGWTNVKTGEVKSPYPGLEVDRCRRMAFAGIHCMSDTIFAKMEELGMPERFSIIDFYLAAADTCPIYGVVAPSLRILDVGKAGAIAEAEKLLSL